MDEQKKKSSTDRTGAYLLIGMGVILLLVNAFNFDLSRLWPLVLVAVGVYLLLGRNSLGSTTRSGHFRAPVDGANSAEYDIRLSVGEATVESLAGGDDLFDADLSYVGDITFEVSGDAHRTIHLSQTGETALAWLNPANWFGSAEHHQWQIGLNRDIPAQLSIHGGVGSADLHLRDLAVTELNLHGGVGEINGELPQSDQGYHADVHGGVGSVRLKIPANTSIDMDIQGGVGEIRLDTDPDVALHIESKGGIGDVSVPKRANRISGGGGDFELGKTGTWETEGFAEMPHQITIRYQGGLGELRVR